MILSDGEIRRALEASDLVIDPLPPPENYSPCSVDLRIGHEFKRWKRLPIGADLTFKLSEISIPEYGELIEDVPLDADGLLSLQPDGFILGRTLETIGLPLIGLLAARVEGRSSIARLGLAIHMTAPTVHLGFEGPLVLEIKNHGPFTLRIEPGKTCVCQVIFERVGEAPQGPLVSDFQGQGDVLGR